MILIKIFLLQDFFDHNKRYFLVNIEISCESEESHVTVVVVVFIVFIVVVDPRNLPLKFGQNIVIKAEKLQKLSV